VRFRAEFEVSFVVLAAVGISAAAKLVAARIRINRAPNVDNAR
jgi:hypothetical protein